MIKPNGWENIKEKGRHWVQGGLRGATPAKVKGGGGRQVDAMDESWELGYFEV